MNEVKENCIYATCFFFFCSFFLIWKISIKQFCERLKEIRNSNM